jgi:putative phosphoesterase
MTIFAISDTHIPDRANKLLEKFLKIVKKDDTILHAGDLVTLDVFKQLEVRARVHAICGNMDDFEVRDFLPKSKIVQLGDLKIGMFHGSGPPEGLVEKIYNHFREKPEVIIFGHSHLPYNKKIGSSLMFNPGSLTGNLMSTSGSYGILHIEDKDIWGEIIEIGRT